MSLQNSNQTVHTDKQRIAKMRLFVDAVEMICTKLKEQYSNDQQLVHHFESLIHLASENKEGRNGK